MASVASDLQGTLMPQAPGIPQAPAPVEQAERITALDTLRGFALLGIFLMNIVFMGLFAAAYDDPVAAGGSTGANLWVWAVLHVLAEGKMRCLFSMVFGAGVILLTSRLERKGGTSADTSADIYYRRTLWLLVFGIADAYLLWAGDILYPYALCALALYPFRKMAAKKLLIIGALFGLLISGAYIGGGFHFRDVITNGRAWAEADRKTGRRQERVRGMAQVQSANPRGAEKRRRRVARKCRERDRSACERRLARTPTAVLHVRGLGHLVHDVHRHGPVQTGGLQRGALHAILCASGADLLRHRVTFEYVVGVVDHQDQFRSGQSLFCELEL
jgi:hypothetical protein